MSPTTRLLSRPGARGRATVGLAVLAYLPLLLTAPGRVGADTKQFLYLDPGRLLSRAPYLWDPGRALGTVTHQGVGYLWPMGPWFWTFDALGFPDWVAQRLWLGTILFAAGTGVLHLARTLAWRGWGPAVAALAYMLSPYSLGYAARISVILLPFAALPWLVSLAIRAARTSSWRHPTLFALVAASAGSINATALLLVGIAPLVWLAVSALVTRDLARRTTVVASLRIGVLTAGMSAWWVAGLVVQGRYGPPVLDYSETLDAVTATATSVEVLRGLGYWFFYGDDKLGPWISSAVPYTQRLVVMAASYLLPIAAVAAAFMVRWRHRAHAVALVAAGSVVAVGAYPYDAPSPVGFLYRELATTTTAGQALRSTGRATPLVVLAMALLLGVGATALVRRQRRTGLVATAVAALVVITAFPPLWNGTLVDDNLDRPEELPDHWLAAADHLDDGDHRTRVLEVPGSDFAAYRWGNTVDPVTPGLIDRPFAARELVGFGAAGANDLLIALDRRMQERIFEPDALAPIARLMGAGDVVFRADLEFERYRTPRPRLLWRELQRAAGLGDEITFGAPEENRPSPSLPLVDEIALGSPELPDPAPVVVLPVEGPLPIVRAHSAGRPLLVSGSGDGLVDAAAAGLHDGRRLTLYSATFADEPQGLDTQLAAGADLLVTDTNRRQARRWRTVRHNTGATERAGEEPVRHDLSDARLNVFPDAGDDARTVVEHRGGAVVSATSYGNPISYTAEDRAVGALDGDPTTAWRTGAFSPVVGERLVIDFPEPRSVDRLVLLQPVTGFRNRWLTSVRLHFAEGPPIDVALDESSRTEPGQVVTFPERRTDRIELELVDHTWSSRRRQAGASGVGFAEVRIPGVLVEEVVRLPRDLFDAMGGGLDHRLAVVLTRLRADQQEAVKEDDELRMVRSVPLPASRSFGLVGQARISADAPDELIDQTLGLEAAAGGGMSTRASSRLSGDLRSRARAAFDGDPTTAWTPAFVPQAGQWVEVELARPRPIEGLRLQVVADGRHSVPTRVTVHADGIEAATVALPDMDDAGPPGRTVTVPLELPELTATTVRVTVDEVREVVTRDWYSLSPIGLPVGFAEVEIPGLAIEEPPAAVPDGCRSDLLTVDGEPVPARVIGSHHDATSRRPLRLEACTRASSVGLEQGDRLIATEDGRTSGIDVDRLVLTSDRGGAAMAATQWPSAPPPAPRLDVVEDDRTALTVRVSGARAGEPFWLVLGHGWNDGWRAEVDGGSVAPEPTLVDGFANGWQVEPDAAELVVRLQWTPQRWVWWGMATSALTALAALVLVVLERRRRTTWLLATATAADPAWSPPTWSALDPTGVRTAAIGAAALGLGTGLLVEPWLAVPAALVGWAALRWRRGRGALAVGAVGSLALAAGFVLARQVVAETPPGFEWPSDLKAVHLVAFGAVVLLVIDVVAERVRRGPPPH